MTSDTVILDVADGVAVATINRPEVHNAMNRQVQEDLRRWLSEAEDDAAIGAVVFTGAGDRAFMAGADIGELMDYTIQTGLESDMARLYDAIEAFPKPTIAAVNGYALGGGCELAMACDIRLASRTARFGLPEAGLSVLPGAGGTQRLGRLIGLGRALELVLTGRLVDADEARAVGLVTEVLEHGDLLSRARVLALHIMAQGPLAVRLAKTVVRASADVDQRTGQLIEQLAQAVLYSTDDKREGADAFLAKRPARLRGR